MTELDVRTTLATGIINYKDENPSVRSFKFISDRTKVAESFIKRIAKKDETVTLDAEKLIKVARLVLPEEKRKFVVTYFFKKVFEESIEDIKTDDHNRILVKRDGSASSKDFEEIVTQEDTLLAYNLACRDKGTDLAEIKSLGEIHYLGFRKLCKLGFVLENTEDGRYHAVKKNWAVGVENMRELLRIYSQCYKFENFGKKRNYAMAYTFGINEEGAERLQNLYRGFIDQIRVIRDENPGERQIVCAGFFDMITNHIFEKQTENNSGKSNFVFLSLCLTLLTSFLFSLNLFAQVHVISPDTIFCSQVKGLDRPFCLTQNLVDDYKFPGVELQQSLVQIKSLDTGSLRKEFQNAFNLSLAESSNIQKESTMLCGITSFDKLECQPTTIDRILDKRDSSRPTIIDRLGKTGGQGDGGG